MKAAGELVVHAATRHFFEGSLGDGQQLLVLGLLIALEEEIDRRRMGELGSLAKPTVAAIKQVGDGLNLRVDDRQVKPRARARERFRLGYGIGERIGRSLQVSALVAKRIRDGHQNAAESRTATLIFRRKIGAAEKRLAIWEQKSRERPTPLAGERADRRLIAGIDIRAFVAINLYGDKILVDDPRDVRILVALPIDDVSPMPPHRPTTQDHRLVFGLWGSGSGVAPLIPVDGLGRRGTRVGARGSLAAHFQVRTDPPLR